MFKTIREKLRTKPITLIGVLAYALRHVLPRTKWGDNIYIFLKFREMNGRWPGQRDLFNDALYRIKISDELTRPERVFTSDKEFVKLYVAGCVGPGYTVPTIAVLCTVEEVRTFDFPEQCVIKPTHGSGDIVIQTPNSKPVDRDALIQAMGRNRYAPTRERNYKSLSGKLIVEPLLFSGQPVHDYKVFCYRGKSKCILYANDRHRKYFRMWFDTNWNSLPVDIFPPEDNKTPKKPQCLQKILDIAEIISNNFDFVRIDFYINNKEFYIGEITHCHQSAAQHFKGIEGEVILTKVIFGE